MPDITYDVGRVSFIMKGAWNLATAYEKLDAVTNNGSLYIAKQDVPGGTAITNTTYWVLAVEKGDQGETGNGIASIAKTGTAGNVDTYTITYTDGTTTTFTVTNGGVTTVNGRTGDVTGLAEEDGNYPLLNAGTADNLTPYSEDSGATQDIPFINEATGGGNGESVVDTGSYLQFKKKLGNTVCVNQLLPALDSKTQNGITGTSNADGSYTINGTATGAFETYKSFAMIAGHKYLFFGIPSGASDSTFYAYFFGARRYASNIFTVVNSGTTTYSIIVPNGATVNNVKWYPEIRDLTLWFGSNDRIPSHLLSHPEDWGKYYSGSLAYDAGHLENADGTVMKSIHRNIWDEEWEVGGINATTGADDSNTDRIRSKNYIPVIPNTEYYGRISSGSLLVYWYDRDKNYIERVNITNTNETSPSNAFFCRFHTYNYGATYLNDITISLYYSGEPGYNQYYPFSVLAEVDTGSEVLRSAGSVADEKTPDGTITRRVGVVDLGTLNWGATSAYGSVHRAQVSISNAVNSNRSVGFLAPMRCVNYTPSWDVTDSEGTATAGLIGIAYNFIFVTFAESKTSAEVKSALNGEMFYYAFSTPTTEQGTAFAENIPCDDFGSMYWTQTKGIPQGNEIFYPVDYKASIDTLYKKVNGDMSKIVTEDEYPEAPSSDGTYVLKATVSGGTKTYAWVAE